MPIQCKKCKKLLPATDYYAQPNSASGRQTTCKTCVKARVRARYYAKREEVAAYERARAQTPHRKAKAIEYQRLRRARHPQKNAARQAVARALRTGAIRRKPCEVCGIAKTEAHHEDYGKPLEVRWLCFAHHRMAHGQKPTLETLRNL